MRKKVFTLIIINTIIFTLGVQSLASSESAILNRLKAVEMVVQNSSAVWDVKKNANFAERDYQKQVLRSQGVNTVKMFLFKHPITDEDIYYYFDPFEQMQMRLLKEFVPEQLKYVWEMQKLLGTVIETSMANAADELFLGLYSAYHGKLLAEKALETSQKSFEREKVRFEKGLITQTELDEANLALLSAKNSVLKAERDFENMHRQFNAMAGLNSEYRYDIIGMPYFTYNSINITEEDAVNKALSNRAEIRDLKNRISLMEFQMDIYTHKNVYKSYPDAREDYKNLQDDLDQLNIRLSQYQYDIEKEIRKMYRELNRCYLDLELAKLNLSRQKKKLETVTAQYQAGLVPESVLEQLELAIYQLEYMVNVNTLIVMNTQDKFNRSLTEGFNTGYFSGGE